MTTRVSTAVRSHSEGFIRALFTRLPPGKILNIGAGMPQSTASVVQWTVHLDLMAAQPKVQSPFVVADACSLPFRNAVFAGALLKDVIEHVVDPIAVLSEAHRVVVPGGSAVVLTPRAVARAVWDDPTHVRGFTQRALHTAASLSGWRVMRPAIRMGALPGAGRLGLESHLEGFMKLPVIGHWFGTNWLIELHRP